MWLFFWKICSRHSGAEELPWKGLDRPLLFSVSTEPTWKGWVQGDNKSQDYNNLGRTLQKLSRPHPCPEVGSALQHPSNWPGFRHTNNLVLHIHIASHRVPQDPASKICLIPTSQPPQQATLDRLWEKAQGPCKEGCHYKGTLFSRWQGTQPHHQLLRPLRLFWSAGKKEMFHLFPKM